MHLTPLTVVAAAFSAVAVLSSLPGADAFFKVSTDSLARARIDSIVTPGAPASHAHAIAGAGNFGLSSTWDSLRTATCTTGLVDVSQDASAYWVPMLYFKHANGTFEAVDDGGLLIYYLFRGDIPIKAFPPGLKFLGGNPMKRSTNFTNPADHSSQAAMMENAVTYTCLRYSANKDGYQRKTLPDTYCESGFRAQINMPGCWDGKNLDSTNHKDHMAYASGLDGGACPSTHPVQLPTLFYENFWSTSKFDKLWNPAKDAWPFVWASGDPTGRSFHADFLNGWDQAVLQKAIDTCPDNNGNTDNCKVLKQTTADSRSACRKQWKNPYPNEQINGQLPRLPGCNPVTNGPTDAMPATCDASGKPVANPPVVNKPTTSANASHASSTASKASSTVSKASSTAAQATTSAVKHHHKHHHKKHHKKHHHKKHHHKKHHHKASSSSVPAAQPTAPAHNSHPNMPWNPQHPQWPHWPAHPEHGHHWGRH